MDRPRSPIAEVTDQLAVRVREAPWEYREPKSGPTADVTSLVVFVMSATIFAEKLYRASSVEACHFRVGIASPAGVRLVVNPQAFMFLSGGFVASSRTDIWIERQPSIRDLETASQRQAFTFGVLEELFDYFGWRIPQTTLDAQVNYIGNQGGLRDA